MLGSSTDAMEIASFVDATSAQEIPNRPEAVEQLLRDMEDAGLLRRLQLPPLDEPRFAKFHSFAPDGGLARELENEE